MFDALARITKQLDNMSRLSMNKIREIYAYREMISSLVRRDLRGRYRGSVLGFAWTFLNPLLQLAVYTLVFSVIMRNGVEDYYLYLFVALIPWIFFSSSVNEGTNCIRSQGGMITKIYFPREVIPISCVTTQFVNMLLSLLVVFAVVMIAGKPFNLLAYLCLPLIMLIEYVLALGMAFLFSAITVYFRDITWFMGIITMAWQFLTPVMYGLDQVPAELVRYFNLNPMTSVIVAYRDILYYGQVPALSTLKNAVICATVVFALGWFVFSKLKNHFAEEL